MSIPEHDRLCEQANKTDLDVRGCICDWISAAEQRTEKRIIKLLEAELTRLSDIVDKGEYFDIARIQFAMQILINLLNEIKNK